MEVTGLTNDTTFFLRTQIQNRAKETMKKIKDAANEKLIRITRFCERRDKIFMCEFEDEYTAMLPSFQGNSSVMPIQVIKNGNEVMYISADACCIPIYFHMEFFQSMWHFELSDYLKTMSSQSDMLD